MQYNLTREKYYNLLVMLTPQDQKTLIDLVESVGGIDEFLRGISFHGIDIVAELESEEPIVTRAQEEMAWRATDELLSKFVKKQ